MSASERLEKRVVELELLFTHLERQVTELHHVVLAQAQRVESLEKQIRSLQRALEDAADEPDDERQHHDQ